MEMVQMAPQMAALNIKKAVFADRGQKTKEADFADLLKGKGKDVSAEVSSNEKKDAATAATKKTEKTEKVQDSEKQSDDLEKDVQGPEKDKKPASSKSDEMIPTEILLGMQTAGAQSQETAALMNQSDIAAEGAESAQEVMSQITATMSEMGEESILAQTSGEEEKSSENQIGLSKLDQTAEGLKDQLPEAVEKLPVHQESEERQTSSKGQEEQQVLFSSKEETKQSEQSERTSLKEGSAEEVQNYHAVNQGQTTASPLQFEAGKMENGNPNVLKTTADTLPEDLGKNLADKLPAKNGTLTIELEPASLGKLTIQLVYENGKAALSIMSTNPKTLELLSQRAGEIAQILEEKTGQETIVYTPSQQENPMDKNPQEESRGREEQQQRHEKRQEQPDSFAQQLRLGLI